MSKSTDIIKLLTPYMMAFPNNKLNEGSLLVYSRALAGFDLLELEAAMNKLMLTSRFFPTVAEIAEQVRNLKDYAAALGGSSQEPTAAEAWEEAMRNVKTHHIYSPWTYSCETVKQTCRQFGVIELCSLESDGVNTARAQFMRMYNSNIGKARDSTANEQAIKALGATKIHQLLGSTEAKLKMIG